MVGIISIIIKMAWLVSSYSLIITYMSGLLPQLSLGLTDLPFFDVVFSFVVSAVTTIRWFIGPAFFNFAVTCWLLTPAIKLGLYLSHKAASFGDLAAFAINESSKN